VADDGVGGGDAAGEFGALQNPMNLRWRRFESQIVVLVAVGAADSVEMLALSLLRGQCWLGVASGEDEWQQGAKAGC
jgi:hypothetical protein